MAGETPRDPLRFGDTLSGSTGWTDEKHMLYISSLELTFVTKLYDREVNSDGVFCWSPSVWRHKTHNGHHRSTQVDQVYCGTTEADRAESRVSQAEHTSCDGDQDDRKAYYTDDEASTSDPRQEGISYYARRKNFGGSSASYLHWHGHSFSGTELSDQNFVDDETEVSEEQMRVCNNKRLKHTTSSPTAPAASANSQREDIHHVEVDYSGSSSDFDVGESASCKNHGSRRWSV